MFPLPSWAQLALKESGNGLLCVQEAKVSHAVELMVAHVENLRRRHDRDVVELEEMKKQTQKNIRGRQVTEIWGKFIKHTHTHSHQLGQWGSWVRFPRPLSSSEQGLAVHTVCYGVFTCSCMT